MKLACYLSVAIIAMAASAIPGPTLSRSATLAAESPTVVATVYTGGNGPMGIGVDETRNLIYAAHIWGGTECSPPCYGPNMVVKIDGNNNYAAANFSSQAQKPWGVAVDSAGNKILVVNNATEYLSILDGTDGSVNSVHMGLGFDGYGIAFNASTGKAYAASYDSKAVYRVTIADGSVTEIGLPGNAYWVALDPTAKRAYVTMLDSFNGVAVINTDTDTWIDTFTGDYDNLAGIAVNTANGDIFAVNRNSKTVTVKDRNGALKGFLTPGSGDRALRGVAVNPNSGHVFVTDGARNLVYVFNAADVSGGNSVSPIASLAVGGRPEYGIAVDVGRSMVYVGNLNDGTVTVIDDTLPQIRLSTGSLGFLAPPGGAVGGQLVAVSDNRDSTLSWSVAVTTTNGGNWLVPSVVSGTNPATVTVGVNTTPDGTSLSAGAYTGRLTFTAPDASNSPQIIDVRLSITTSIQKIYGPIIAKSLSFGW